jgi:hypothetical protein
VRPLGWAFATAIASGVADATEPPSKIEVVEAREQNAGLRERSSTAVVRRSWRSHAW